MMTTNHLDIRGQILNQASSINVNKIFVNLRNVQFSTSVTVRISSTFNLQIASFSLHLFREQQL